MMKNFLSLRMLDFCSRLFTMLGVDYPVMRRILQVKLTMDQRRVPTIFEQSKTKEGNQFIKSLGLYAFYGLILVPFIIFGDYYLFQMTLVFAMMMFILMTTMIADFSAVLLDVRDKNILNTKPVNQRTVSTAKAVHVCIYMIQLTGAFAAVPLLVGLFVKGVLFTVIFLFELLLVGMLIVVLTALIYIFILQFFDGERLKDVINYVQILLSVGIVVGFQVMARVFDFSDLNVDFTFQWWHLLLPPIWYSAPFEWLLNGNSASYIIGYSIMSVVVPIAAIVLYSRLLPSFERNLQKLLQYSGVNKRKAYRLDQLLAKIVCKTKEERTFYRFSALMMKQERQFKLKVYPSLGFAFVFPFIFLFNEISRNGFGSLPGSKYFLTIYFGNIMIPAVVHMLKFSSNYKGAWIFRAAPIRNEAIFYQSALKAFLTKLYLPLMVLLSIIFVSMFSFRIVPDVIVVLLAGVLHALLSYKLLNNQTHPFSRSFEFASEVDTAKNIILIAIIGGFAVLHYLATLVPYGVLGYLGIVLIAVFISWRLVFPAKEKKLLISQA
ncbi:hypothetical protein [Sediminibacillus albus]|uniref:ABC-2 type transport system permease protein n=1 Tax=Sediminibacillus albus TaxID=407036 RepID=A0A1G8Y5V7_9BACI|nr:hypothetical protein [Sediminibacillus albus]SDJ98218.1 hypothetical protein SAMN05216243_1426 [Sediminibacillus albus]